MHAVRWLDEHIEEAFLVILLILMSCVEIMQVLARNLPFLSSLTWAEEFCRFCWIWSVFLSLPYTIRKGNMLRVSVLLDALPQGMRSGLNLIVELIVAGMMLLLGCHSITVVRDILHSGETSPAMLLPMWGIYSVMLIGFFLAFLRGIQRAAHHIRHFRQRELSTMEQMMAEAEQEVDAGARKQKEG